MSGQTVITIHGDRFLLNGLPTYPGRSWQGRRIEGLLLNARLVQGLFDDRNPLTVSRWAYPDTGRWDADRNTSEFVAAMSEWRRHGLLAFTVNLQGGSPEGYSQAQPWHHSAFEPDGSLRPDYVARLALILDAADRLGMAVILGLFYFGQDERLEDEAAVCRGADAVVDWLAERGDGHVLIEIDNECDVPAYEHPILTPPRVHELIERVQQRSGERGHPLLTSVSFAGGSIPTENVVRTADFLLLHGNGVGRPGGIADMIARTRALPGYRPMPIVFNEDDHFDFDRPDCNFLQALDGYASWGYFDPGASNYCDGYQCPPVNWAINTERKRAFYRKLAEVAGSG